VKPREAVLERRKQYLVAKIAAQRAQLGYELGAFRGPLHAFEVARGVGESVRRHAPLAGGIVATVGFFLMRGGLVSRTFRTVQLANKTARWWAVVRLGLQLAQRWRSTPA
jgi:hypothetical protein